MTFIQALKVSVGSAAQPVVFRLVIKCAFHICACSLLYVNDGNLGNIVITSD